MGVLNIKFLNKLLNGIVKKDDLQIFLMFVYFGFCINIYDRNGDFFFLMLYLMLMVMLEYQIIFILNFEERMVLMLIVEFDNIRVICMVVCMLKRKKCKKEMRLRS